MTKRLTSRRFDELNGVVRAVWCRALQGKANDNAATRWLAVVGGDGPIVGEHDSFDEGQTEAKTGRGAALNARLEDIRHNIRRKAGAIVFE